MALQLGRGPWGLWGVLWLRRFILLKCFAGKHLGSPPAFRLQIQPARHRRQIMSQTVIVLWSFV